jgi:hypothetical protein
MCIIMVERPPAAGKERKGVDVGAVWWCERSSSLAMEKFAGAE